MNITFKNILKTIDRNWEEADKNLECRQCFDSGKVFRPNLQDDFDTDFCGCPKGQEAESKFLSDVEQE